MSIQFNNILVKPNTYSYTLNTGDDHVTTIVITDAKTGKQKIFALAGIEPGSFRESQVNSYMQSLTTANIEMWFKESR